MDSSELLRVAFIFVCTHWIITKIFRASVCIVCNREEMYAKKELWRILNEETNEETNGETNEETNRDDVSDASTEEMLMGDLDLDRMLEELNKDD